ncbi:hypothetical protein KDA_42770 [Dictyobacter alpinus]|uniref:Uncharacterized protein n=1 Tax=Dictyobacter alpinus TaxID=2014873 RepID=A0A402BBM4_9CHLR|nr:hypothetical protein [Dictyobacter alpinus]GCE28793.1 hypothetical protein KDA_42770 [Dictyobacter alpinus]
MLQNNTALAFKQPIIALVALGASITFLQTLYHFSFWTTIIGATLLQILHTYGHAQPASRAECVTYAAVWALCLLLTISWFLTGLNILFFSHLPRLATTINGMSLRLDYFDILMFVCWLLAFLIVSNREIQHLKRPQVERAL